MLSGNFYSQNLSFQELIILKEMPMKASETFLDKKGWSINTRENDERFTSTIFTYKSNDNRAGSLIIKHLMKNNDDRLLVQIRDKNKYQE